MLNLIPLIYELRFRIRWDQPLAVIVETWRQTSTGRECWPGNHQRSRSPKTGEVKTSTQEPWRGTSYPHMKPMTSRMHPKLMFTGCSKVSAIHVEPFCVHGSSFMSFECAWPLGWTISLMTWDYRFAPSYLHYIYLHYMISPLVCDFSWQFVP